MPHYKLRNGETDRVRSTKMASTAEAIFYAGESSQCPDLKLQLWGNAKDDVGNARQQLELLHNDKVLHIGVQNGVFTVSSFKARKYANKLLICVI